MFNNNICADQKEFEKILDEMDAHAIECAKTWKSKNMSARIYYSYVLPSSISRLAAEEKLPDAACDVFLEEEAEINEDNDHEKLELENTTSNRLSDKLDQTSYEQKLDDLDDDAIENYIKRRKNNTQRLKDIGKRYPESRNTIVYTRHKANVFLDALYAGISEFVGQLISSIEEWVHSAMLKIRDTFEDVYKKVTGFFKGLFTSDGKNAYDDTQAIIFTNCTGCDVYLTGMGMNRELYQGWIEKFSKVVGKVDSTWLQVEFMHEGNLYLSLCDINTNRVTEVKLEDGAIVVR